ncbi:hypothetical protein [Phenylobacterium kunshanense]|uniref:Uncharacterized protein n=1 Tax=Phenylobacterium kunshanense TaxID=1445034 RepID=A0A328BP98_9CAUL|nr:hypothetical protein [Phenylobacterium kunshanense]RAK67754.1 hypothetical protein DJ019_07585 [Phenylobacterium kunshanense]
MLRLILGVVAGCALAMGLITGIELVVHTQYPYPAGASPEQLRNYVLELPQAGQAMIIAAWIIGTAVGGLAGNGIAGRPWPALVVGVLIAVSGMANMAMLPHPLWMQIVGIVGPLAVAGVLGLGRPRRAPAA